MDEGKCPTGQFECKTENQLTCLSKQWTCDGKDDCDDGLDEANCTHCNTDLWECRAKNPPYIKCLDHSWRCDGRNDCEFGEDELDCIHTTQTGSDETSVITVQDKTENESVVQSVFKSPYFVYGLLSTVFILIVVLVVVCVCRSWHKTRRRRTLRSNASERKHFLSESSTGPMGISSMSTASNIDSTERFSDIHTYQDIESNKHPSLLLTRTGTHSRAKSCPEKTYADNIDRLFDKAVCQDNASCRSSSYAAVVSFNKGKPFARTNYYEQPLKSEMKSIYLSILEDTVSENVFVVNEEQKGIPDAGKEVIKELRDDSVNENFVLEDTCTGYGQSVVNNSDKINTDTVRYMHKSLAGVPNPKQNFGNSSIEIKLPQTEGDINDYIHPIYGDSDYIHPV